jgi:NAD-dependent deacetylase
MSETLPDRIAIPEALVAAIRAAEHVVVLTGAGISKESGVPTFREAQTGLWANYDPQELATAEAFERDPRRVWEWYAWRRQLVGQVAPNAGHFALAALEERVPRFTLITQNIDELHQRAGSHETIELHGSLGRCRCTQCDEVTREWTEGEEAPPACPNCGAMLRPDVVWFGEALPFDALARAVAATHDADLFFSVGTSSVVYPAAALPLEAIEHGAMAVEVNPEETPATMMMDFVLQGPAGRILPQLITAAWPEWTAPGGADGSRAAGI